MSIIIKIYQNKLINEVLAASTFQEVKNGINDTFSALKKQNVADKQVLDLVEEALKELKSLNQRKLSYDQHANIISAKLQLQQLQLQMTNVTN